MDLTGTFDISASALRAERLRLDAIASNLANATTTRTPASWRSALNRCAASATSALIAITTTWTGASAGGRRRPSSSPCTMISPPSIRVEVPHDVVQASSC